MNAEIISIGDELVSGDRLDTNSQWVSRRLAELGVRVLFHSSVGDDLQACIDTFRHASQRAEIILSSGGLGPTADDLTRQALADAAGVPLVLDPDVLCHIESLFAARGYSMPEKNRVQAMFPQGAQPIPNPHGTAPGISMRLSRDEDPAARIFALPGVLEELREMWTQTVAPGIEKMGGPRPAILQRTLKCFGVGESQLEAMLPDLVRRGKEPSVGITVHAGTISLRITARGSEARACRQQIETTCETIHECLGTLVFGEDDEALEDVVLRLLQDQDATLATIECGTEGRLAGCLAQASGSEDSYRGGTVLPVAGIHVSEDDPREIIQRMAEDCRSQMASDYALAIGPIAELSASAQPGSYFYALSGPEGTLVRSSSNASHPAILRDLAAKKALNLLRLQLMELC